MSPTLVTASKKWRLPTKTRAAVSPAGRQGVCVTKKKILLLALIASLGVAYSIAQAQVERRRLTKEFMRDKLELAQRVLEGLALEDYSLIAAKGAKLNAMSAESAWRAFENPDYDVQSATFRRHVRSLIKAAEDENLDAATLAYVGMTMSCVECHRLVRGKLVAANPRAMFNLGLFSAP